MKKVLALVLSLLMVFVLFGCDSGGDNTDETSTAAPSANETEVAETETGSSAEGLTFALVANTMTYAFCQALAAGLEEHATEDGAEMIVASADNDNEVLVQLIETYSLQTDGIFAQTSGDIGNRIVDICTEAGVPVLSVSTNLVDATSGKLLTAGVELNAYDCGYRCSRWTCENYEALGYDASDMDTLGIIVVTYSAIPNFTERAHGRFRRL